MSIADWVDNLTSFWRKMDFLIPPPLYSSLGKETRIAGEFPGETSAYKH